MTDDLVERVAQALASAHGYKPDELTYREARAAIAVVLEEAAKEMERLNIYNAAAAIRAMKGGANG